MKCGKSPLKKTDTQSTPYNQREQILGHVTKEKEDPQQLSKREFRVGQKMASSAPLKTNKGAAPRTEQNLRTLTNVKQSGVAGLGKDRKKKPKYPARRKKRCWTDQPKPKSINMG